MNSYNTFNNIFFKHNKLPQYADGDSTTDVVGEVKACKDKLTLVRHHYQRIKSSMISFFEAFADQIHNHPKIIKDKVSVPADAI